MYPDWLSEDENVRKYEKPIAKQLGEPTRKNYRDESGFQRMENSTHYVTKHYVPLWEYWTNPIYRGKSRWYVVNHNVSTKIKPMH